MENYKEKYECLEKHYNELIENYNNLKDVVINSLESLKGQEVCEYDKGYNVGVEESIAVVADMAIPTDVRTPFLITRLEYELLKYWGKKYKYIARDKDSALYVYHEMPVKNDEVWGTLYGYAICLNNFDDLFKFVEWSDKEPMNIEKLLNECEVIECD